MPEKIKNKINILENEFSKAIILKHDVLKETKYSFNLPKNNGRFNDKINSPDFIRKIFEPRNP